MKGNSATLRGPEDTSGTPSGLLQMLRDLAPAPHFTDAIRRRLRGSRRTGLSANGQSVTEFALVLPIMVILLFAVFDFARVYTTMLTVESAAREAADYGTFGSQKWNDTIYSLPVTGTEAQMLHRACVATSNLPDYEGPDDACTNPAFSYELSGDKGVTWEPYSMALGCDNETREPPCWVRVTLTYEFKLFVPLNIELSGSTFGFPSSITVERTSIYPMTDLTLP
jgi:TadE-like protein